MLTTSDVLGDRYRLDGPVAAGGMGEVWRATDTVLGRTVAVKVMRADPRLAARFRAEARTLATVHHPGVVEVYDYGEVDGESYLVMAYVHGEPLSHRLAAAGRLSADETMSVVGQVAHALAAAHAAGVVHRDVKPDNLLIDDDGRVVLVDFGVAYTEGAAALTGTREVIGTARYMAPEQVSKHPATAATDVYALGAVAYECLAGRPPFTAETALAVALAHLSDEPDPLPPDVPAAARDVVTTAMAKDPTRRYPSAEAMAAAAEAARAGGARGGSTLQFAAVPDLDDTSPVRPGAVVGVAAPAGYAAGYAADYAAPDDYPAPGELGFPAGGYAPRRNGRRVAVAVALCAVLLGAIGVLIALADGGRNGNQLPATPSTSASRPHSTKPSTPRSTPSTSSRTSTKPSTSPTATTTPSVSPSPTPTTAPPTTTAPATSEPPTSPAGGGGSSG